MMKGISKLAKIITKILEVFHWVGAGLMVVATWKSAVPAHCPHIRTRLRRNTENEVPNCFKPRKSCQQSYSYLPAAICCG